MEFAYYLSLAIFYIMALAAYYITNRHDNQGRIEKKDILKIALFAPIIIVAAFEIGQLLSGNMIKFIVILGASALIRLYLHFKPDAFKRYDKNVRKYAGLLMAVILALLITGCAGSSNQKIGTNLSDKQKQELIQQFEPPNQPEKGRGSGVIR